MRAIAYMRRSQDSGTGVSEEIQDEAIREYVERKGGTVTHWLPPDLDASSWTLDRPSMKKALELLAAGKADTLVVAKFSRVTRRRADWEQLLALMNDQGWTIKSADFDVDLSDKGGRLIAGIIIDFLGFEYEERRDSYDDARRNAVLTHGVHGGTTPPLGYEFTVRGKDRTGASQRGPLKPNKDAKRVLAAFKARASDDPRERAWSNVLRILGIRSQGNAVAIIANRVYLGEARSGEYAKPNAHPAILKGPEGEALFRRANRRRTERSVSYRDREGALLGGKIVRCATCGYSMSLNRDPRGHYYRCQTISCTERASVLAATIEPYVFLHALAWHATLGPMHISDLDEVGRAVYEEELAKAQAERAEVERLHADGELSPVAYGKALTAAEYAVQAAEVSLADAEASNGWLGMSTDTVQKRLLGDGNVCKDVEAGRDFIRQMVKVTVRPVGRGRKVPIAERVEIENLTPVAALAEEAYIQIEMTA
jgi:DNA invertase Pin-like site-specific DNA recombinase